MLTIHFRGFAFRVSFDSTENEYCATHNGFSAYAKTQHGAISLCYAMMQETFQGEDEE